VSELIAELHDTGPVLVTGDIDEDQAGQIDLIDGVTMPSSALRIRQPAALAELAWRRWQAGRIDDAAAIEPIYLSR